MNKVLIKSLLVNLVLSILKLIGSFIGGSITLLADAIHCMSDMFTDVISIIGSKLSNKKPDKEHPYGHGRIEYLTSIVMSIFIIILSISTLITSIKGEKLNTNIYAVIILIVSIISKFILSDYLIKKSKELNSNIILLNGMETRYDTYSSMLALLFVLLSLISNKGILKYADIIGGVIISLLTIKVGIKLLLSNISSIIGEVDYNKDKINLINSVILEQKEIKSIRRTTLLKMGTYYKVILDLNINGDIVLNDMYEIEKKIKIDLKKLDLNIRYVTVNFKPVNNKNST